MYGNIAAPRHLNWVPGLPLRVVMLAIAVGFAALWCVDMAGRALAARPANETAALARIAETAQLVDELRGQVAAAVAATAGGAGAVHLDKATVTLAAFAQHHARNVADFQHAQSGALHATLIAALACVLAIVVSVGCAVYVRRRFVVPLALLAHVMSVIRDDRNFSRRAGVHGHPAVARVSGEFNALMAGVQRAAGDAGLEYSTAFKPRG